MLFYHAAQNSKITEVLRNVLLKSVELTSSPEWLKNVYWNFSLSLMSVFEILFVFAAVYGTTPWNSSSSSIKFILVQSKNENYNYIISKWHKIIKHGCACGCAWLCFLAIICILALHIIYYISPSKKYIYILSQKCWLDQLVSNLKHWRCKHSQFWLIVSSTTKTESLNYISLFSKYLILGIKNLCNDEWIEIINQQAEMVNRT